MKGKSVKKPDERVTLETIPSKPGYVSATLIDNIEPCSWTAKDGVINGYSYDEYQYVITQYSDLESMKADIEANFTAFFNAAKAEAIVNNPPNIEQLRADVDFIMAMEGLK